LLKIKEYIGEPGRLKSGFALVALAIGATCLVAISPAEASPSCSQVALAPKVKVIHSSVFSISKDWIQVEVRDQHSACRLKIDFIGTTAAGGQKTLLKGLQINRTQKKSGDYAFASLVSLSRPNFDSSCKHNSWLQLGFLIHYGSQSGFLAAEPGSLNVCSGTISSGGTTLLPSLG
jgi:hypothetical protein